jgi:hypothetical protein
MAMAILVDTGNGAPALLTVPAVPEVVRVAPAFTAEPEAATAPPEAGREAPTLTAEPEEQKPGLMLAPPPPEVSTGAPRQGAEEPQKGKPEITLAPAKPVPEKAPMLAPTPSVAPSPEVDVKEEAEDTEGIVVDETLDRRARLRLLLAQNAIKHPEALRAALERVPDSARPALLRALEASNMEYEKLLQLLEETEDDEDEEDEGAVNEEEGENKNSLKR